jgi:hypothetical protein
MKYEVIAALQAHLQGHIAKHQLNVMVMLENPMAIHDHTDLIGAIENELGHIAEYQDKLDALENIVK